MEDTPQVAQNKPSILGGNYAPANSCTSSNKELSGLTLPSFEQFHDESHSGLDGTEDDLFAFDPELERTIFGDSFLGTGFTDAIFDTEQFSLSLTTNTAQFEGGRKPTSNHDPPSHAAPEEQIPSHFLSQAGTSSERPSVITASTTSLRTASGANQESLESEPSNSEVHMLDEENEPCHETAPDASAAHHEARLPAQEGASSRTPLNIHLSQPAPYATRIHTTEMTGSSSYHRFCNQAPRSISQADTHRTIDSMNANHGSLIQQTFSSQHIPDQIIQDQNLQGGYIPDQGFNSEHSMGHGRRATDRNGTASSSYPSPSSSDLSFDSFPRGNRDLIRPELRTAIERFEKKVETDEEVRQAFNIVFPGRSAEVEQLKNTIILEREQAASRERALHNIVKQLRLFLPNNGKLEPRTGEVAETLLETPKENHYWMCRLQDLRITSQPCGGINQEWYFEKPMWILRRKCSKCMRPCGAGYRQRVSDDFVKATNATIPPPTSKRPYKKRKQSRVIDLTVGETYVEAAHRLSLPVVTSVAEALARKAESSRSNRSLSPHLNTRTEVGTFKIPESTRDVLRRQLGLKDGWVGSHERNEVIDLNGDDKASGQGSQQEPRVDLQKGGNGDDIHEGDLEVDLEKDMMAEYEAAGL